MKKALLVVLAVMVIASVAMAQIPQASQSTTDTLGAHLLYGRGCVGCHAPHSGSQGNGITPKNGDSANGNLALWGQDLSPLYGQTVAFGGGSYSFTLPAQGTITSVSDPATVTLLCLSCHDGNLAKVAMVTGKTVETLPIVGGNAPTLLGNDGSTVGNYKNDHPVGPTAEFGCGGQYNWDCVAATATSGPQMTGTASAQFVKNYGFAVSFGLSADGTKDAVMCTSCHNQHSETIYSGTMGGTKGYYQTMFFLKGYYNPTTGGNNSAQFCRQCHGGNSNEMLGQTGVPTT